MRKSIVTARTSITLNQSQEGETIEDKIERIVNNNEAITDGAPIVYTERKDGVLPEYNIRTDRFEIAVTAMDRVHRSAIARREDAIKEREKEVNDLHEKQNGVEKTDEKGVKTEGKTEGEA